MKYLMLALRENRKKQFDEFTVDDVSINILAVPPHLMSPHLTQLDPFNPEKEFA
jgi:hypothetical protein